MNLLTPDQRASAIQSILRAAPVMPVIVIEHLDDAVQLASALVEGGLRVLEVTLRTEVALEAIARITDEVEGAIVGAGTVLHPRDLDAVQQSGGRFAIAPGCTPALYGAANQSPLPFLPGASTASELMQGMEHGHHTFKFFPAEAAGGVQALKAYAGPFASLRFCPTGGIDAAKAPAYLALSNVLTVGGSWMLPADAIQARDWARITKLAREAAALRNP